MPRSRASSLEEKGLAARELGGRGLVGGRRAAERRRDVGAAQAEAVVTVPRRRPGGEAGGVQRAVEPFAAPVAREHPPGAVTTVRGGGQPHHEDARARIAEAGQRARPVGLATVPARGRGGGRLAVPDEAGTAAACDDACGELGERSRLVLAGDFGDNHGAMIPNGGERRQAECPPSSCTAAPAPIPGRGARSCARASRRRARGLGRLAAGGSSLDAVEAAVRALEDHPRFNAGRGSVLTSAGTVEMDASIMEGDRLATARWPRDRPPPSRHPCPPHPRGGPAFALRRRGRPRSARALGVPLCDPALVTEQQRRRSAVAQEAQAGTVGAVALDRAGVIAAATSTGGMTNKLPGRVGDSPLIGCGTYAESTLGGVSCTGDGEAIIRVVLARRTLEIMKSVGDPMHACQIAVDVLVEEGRGGGGLIGVDWKGRIGWAHSTPLMPVGWAARPRAWWSAFDRGRERDGPGRGRGGGARPPGRRHLRDPMRLLPEPQRPDGDARASSSSRTSRSPGPSRSAAPPTFSSSSPPRSGGAGW